MKDQYILALDQGTTSSRSVIVNANGQIVALQQQDFEQIFPQSGWVEHNPMAIWESQLHTLKAVINEANISSKDIVAIGITNQRETVVVWDKTTGQPIYNAIVWQDRRTAEYCDTLKTEGHAETIKQKTGLVIDAYFSATKLKWILDHVEGARQKAEQGELCFGTVDTWLIYNLTKGKTFVTDTSNASRTMLFNIHTLDWDEDLLALFNIPKSILPEVKESSTVYGHCDTSICDTSIPIAGIAGDQQAALFGQLCTEKGMVKNTYGTGCFLLMNTGETPVASNHNLLTTVAWTLNGKTHYALEGSVFVGGAVVQWLRDGLQLIDTSESVESLAKTETDNGGVYFVPALTGLGAPYWDAYARGSLFGISRGTTQGHIARATLEGIAFQVYDIVKAMEQDAGEQLSELRVDGGATSNNLLMQFQSDIFKSKVVRPKSLETTVLGASFLAGLAVGFWDSLDDLKDQWKIDTTFTPKMDKEQVTSTLNKWHKAVECARAFN